MRQLFISDLHIWQNTPRIEELFHQFMQQQAQQADQLYVLGDLFEVWLGDDAIDATAERIIHSFSQYTSQGGKLYFMHGNRDFLLGDDFLQATTGVLLTDPFSLDVGGIKTILMHGDSLCTQDTEYIAYRNQVRSLKWQQEFLSQSIQERHDIARNIRNISSSRGQTMSEEISDVTQSAVVDVMSNANASLLIHGHTHRQNRHKLTVNNKDAERIVLGDWGKTGSVLIVDDAQIQLKNFSLN